VHRAGAPSLDHLRRDLFLHGSNSKPGYKGISRPALAGRLSSVTLAPDTLAEADALFAALEALPDDMLFCYPNADAGSRALIERTKAFLASRGRGAIFTNLDAVTYWSLLAQVKMLIGNSSSGIMETASFQLPTVMLACGNKAANAPGMCWTLRQTRAPS